MATTKTATRARRSTSSKATSAKTSTTKTKQIRNKPSYKTLYENEQRDNVKLVERNIELSKEARHERESARQANARGKTAFDVLRKVEIQLYWSKRVILVLVALLVLAVIVAVSR